MGRLYVFGDESGNFHFTSEPHGTRVFLVCTVAFKDCSAAHELLNLRRQLVWDEAPVADHFHATEDKQDVRDAVFGALHSMDFSIQATILEKSKAQPQTRLSNARFYHYAWYYHWKYVAPKLMNRNTEVLITTAKVDKAPKKQATFTSAVNDSLQQTTQSKWLAHFCLSATEPGLQIADYCAWAIFRKWESSGRDTRSYDLIRTKIIHEADMWRRGTHHYYAK